MASPTDLLIMCHVCLASVFSLIARIFYKLIAYVSLPSMLVTVGIHASINVHEYHCIAIRMRCRLVDV